jgi:hypothetical protein
MTTGMIIFVAAIGIIAIDTLAVAYGVHVGMKHPFLAAAVVNVIGTLITQMAMLVHMIMRSLDQ